MSKIGPPDYPEATQIAQAFVKAAPERLVWGSDWPHPSEQNGTLPDDAMLFDLLAVWAHDEPTRGRILVDNPEILMGSRNRRDCGTCRDRDATSTIIRRATPRRIKANPGP